MNTELIDFLKEKNPNIEVNLPFDGWFNLIRCFLSNVKDKNKKVVFNKNLSLLIIKMEDPSPEETLLINYIEELSSTTCENCGSPGESCFIENTMFCLCEDCAESSFENYSNPIPNDDRVYYVQDKEINFIYGKMAKDIKGLKFVSTHMFKFFKKV